MEKINIKLNIKIQAKRMLKEWRTGCKGHLLHMELLDNSLNGWIEINGHEHPNYYDSKEGRPYAHIQCVNEKRLSAEHKEYIIEIISNEINKIKNK